MDFFWIREEILLVMGKSNKSTIKENKILCMMLNKKVENKELQTNNGLTVRGKNFPVVVEISDACGRI